MDKNTLYFTLIKADNVQQDGEVNFVFKTFFTLIKQNEPKPVSFGKRDIQKAFIPLGMNVQKMLDMIGLFQMDKGLVEISENGPQNRLIIYEFGEEGNLFPKCSLMYLYFR